MKEVIIDMNVLRDTLFGSGNNCLSKVREGLLYPGQKPKLVGHYGGQLAVEYRRLRKFRSLIVELDQAGRLRRLIDDDVIDETNKFKKNSEVTSDDEHILAIAIVGGARTVCTFDKELTDDFKNPKLIKGGKVYCGRRKSHHLVA